MTEYRIRRTSDIDGTKGPPCDGAYTKDEFDYEPVEDHHQYSGMEFTPWFYEIESLGDLFWLISKVGKIIIHPANSNWMTGIEIYDSYRE